MTSVIPYQGVILSAISATSVSYGNHVRITWLDWLLLAIFLAYSLAWRSSLRDGDVVSGYWLGLHVVFCLLFSVWIWWTTVFAWMSAPIPPSSNLAVEAGFAALLWFIVPLACLYYGHRWGLRWGTERYVVRRLAARIWMVQGAAPVPAVWLGFWVARFLIEDLALNGYSVFLPLEAYPAGVNAAVFIAGVFAVGVLYLLGFGLMIGYSRAIWRQYRAQRNAPFQLPAVPPPRSTNA